MSETQLCPQCGGEIQPARPPDFARNAWCWPGWKAGQPPIPKPRPRSPRRPPRPRASSRRRSRKLRRKFPQLEIIELLGRGGMGAVYKARQRQLDRLVAVKILPPEITGDPAFAERFNREARAMARFSHPNIVGSGPWLWEISRTDGRPVLLRHGIRRRREPPSGDPDRPHGPQAGPGDHAADLRRLAICPRRRHCPSRHQAGEHPHRQARAGEDRGLRPGQAVRPGDGRSWPDGHASK